MDFLAQQLLQILVCEVVAIMDAPSIRGGWRLIWCNDSRGRWRGAGVGSRQIAHGGTMAQLKRLTEVAELRLVPVSGG